MPNLNEFLKKEEKKEIISTLEIVEGNKPCSKCDKNAEQSSWDPDLMTLQWECPDGHKNEIRVG